MNGFQLYKQYMTRAEAAGRGTPAWAYGQLLVTAFELVGVTRLFDMLEQADVLGGNWRWCIGLRGKEPRPTPVTLSSFRRTALAG